MKLIKVYEYTNCGTCKKALKFLANRRFAVEKIDIFTQPPSRAELKKMIEFQSGNFRRLFNTSGKVYQEMGLAEKAKSMTEEEALSLLSANGKLIKKQVTFFLS